MSAHDGDCIAPCQLACPANTDCQGYVGLIANGEFDSALKLIKKRNSASCIYRQSVSAPLRKGLQKRKG